MPSQVQDEQEQREALRRLHQVRPVTEEEEGTGVDRLPAGVFGFTHSPALENSPLFRRKLFYMFEVHKAVDGDVYLIGFLPPDRAAQVESGQGTLEIRLYPDPQDEGITPVSIPVTRLIRTRDQSFRDGQGLELQVIPSHRRI
jgi:hypothetical protein